MAPRFVLPGLAPELPLLGDGVEAPDERTGARVVGPDVARRDAAVDEAIADRAADDHQVLVHHRRRVELEVAALDRPDQVLAQVQHPVLAERRHHLAALGVDAEQAVAARQEDAQVVAIPPHRDAAMPESTADGRHAVGVGPRIEDPLLGARHGVQRGDAVVVGAHVDRAVHHDRRAGEVSGHGAELRPRPIFGPPRPGHLQLVDVLRRHRIRRRVPGVGGVRPDVRPLHHAAVILRGGLLRARGKQRERPGQQPDQRPAAQLARGCQQTRRRMSRFSCSSHRCLANSVSFRNTPVIRRRDRRPAPRGRRPAPGASIARRRGAA